MGDVENPAVNPATSAAYATGSAAPASHVPTRQGVKIAFVFVSVAVVGLTLGLVFGLGGRGGNNGSAAENSNADEANKVDNFLSPEESSVLNPSDSTSLAEKNDHEENGGHLDPPNESDVGESQNVGMESAEVVVESEFPAQYFRSEGPIPAQVRAFPPPVSDAYETCSDLENDVAEALKFYANQVIMEQSKDDLYSNCDPANPNWMSEYYGYDYPYSYLPPPVMYGYGYDETQVEEELSNGTVAVKRSYDVHKNFQMRHRDSNVSSHKSRKSGADTRANPGVTEDSFHTNSQVYGVDNADIAKSDGNHVFAAYGDVLYAWNSENGGTDGVSMTTMPLGDAEDCSDYYTYGYSNDTVPCTYVSKPRVQALLLNGDRLTAVVTQDRYDGTIPMVYDYSILSVRVYDISTVPNDGSPLVELGTTNITGSFWSGRSVGDTNLIVSMSYINAYMFAEDLYRYQPQYCGLNTSEYIQLANETAVAKDAASVAKEIVDGLQLDGDCSRVFHIIAMQDPNSSAGTGNENSNSDFDGINILGQFAHITSIDVSSSAGVDGIIPAIVSGTFIPGGGYLSSIYVTEDLIVTSSSGYSYNETTGISAAHTYFLGFDTTSGVAMPYCVGKVDGSIYNEYFVDKFGDHLRVVTTDFESNKMFVLRLPSLQDGPLMEVVGESDQLGNISSSILGVRFFEDEAFIATYGQNDPLIVVDLSEPEHPRSVGVLEAPGQSTYLKRVEIDGSPFILGIGNYWNEVTYESGLKLNLFDIANKSSPKLAAEYTANIGTTTNAAYDFLAARYLLDSNTLIIPLSWYSVDGLLFNSFAVYEVSTVEIKPLYNVSSSEQPDNCWYDVYIQPRSFVFQSKLTTISGHTVVNFDMNKEEKLWELDLDVGLNYSLCVTYSYSSVEYERANSTWEPADSTWDYEYADDDLNA